MPPTTQFTFLLPAFGSIADPAIRAEAFASPDPRAACFYARRALELLVNHLFDTDTDFTRPWESSLSSLLAAPSFKQHVPAAIVAKTNIIRNLGNDAVHSKKPIRATDGIAAVRELFHICYWFARTYSKDWKHEGLAFDEARLTAPRPATAAAPAPPAIKPEELEKLRDELKAKDDALRASREQIEKTDAEIKSLQTEIEASKARAETTPDTHDYSEAKTRDFFIDLMLRESGWGSKDWKLGEDIEYRVKDMAKGSGKTGDGYIDYVLWGDDGKPLAIVEAKRTRKDSRIGQQQASLYADCLEKEFGRRPIIYFTNGYESWIWDDHFYPPRAVSGFHTKDELELLIGRRTSRKDPGKETVNREIVGRPYQLEAIREVRNRLMAKHRRGLLVMATGSGKTRVAIALVDLLMRAGWVKRVLFLADRTALVVQAENEFKKHLPDCSPVNLVTDKTSTGRVYLSTYPTMLNLIDGMRTGESGVERRFGPGHFDLIIIDEAHRSVYQKFRAIFEYFDSLLFGLTATPRAEVDHDTYKLFDLEQGMPTFAYELDDAVKDGFLVPYKAISVPLKFQRQGLKYDEMSDEEKARWDEIDWDEDGNIPTEVDPESVNKWLFNDDTVDKVLAHLMQKGLKVAGGDRLGKTIIFAKNKDHARFIEKRFNLHYPHLRGVFARVIDHYEPYAAVLLEQFKIDQKTPHIAISVDMLDTGIDVPECVNLVFFKLIRSRTKFWQMIGRGTRLCEDLFGPGQDKQFFYIFDFCQNLEYFNQNPDGIEGKTQISLGAMIFAKRLELHQTTTPLAAKDHTIKALRDEVADTLQSQVSAMNVENFIVRTKRRSVEKFRDRALWDALTPTDYAQAADDLASLPAEIAPEDETAKRFDLLMLRLQLALLNHETKYDTYRTQVIEIAAALSEKKDIPVVDAQMTLILDLQTDEWWQNVTLPMLENVRKKLRDLVKFIDKSGRNIVYTSFEDELGEAQEIDIGSISATVNTAQYQKKVLAFLKEHENHITIRKVRMGEQLTESDLTELDRLLYKTSDLGGKDAFEKAFGPQQSLGLFIRSLVGLDRAAAQTAFSEFLDNSRHNADQIRFVNLIIEHLTKNGVMDPGQLYHSPYTDSSPAGIDGLFDDSHAEQIIGIIRRINDSTTARAASK